ERCTIQIAYAIGVADPMSLLVDSHGTGEGDEDKLHDVLLEIFPLRPTSIRRGLKLNRPIYRRTAAYGHFGRAPEKDGGFSWARSDLADALKRAMRSPSQARLLGPPQRPCAEAAAGGVVRRAAAAPCCRARHAGSHRSRHALSSLHRRGPARDRVWRRRALGGGSRAIC